MHPLQAVAYFVAPFWELWLRFSRSEKALTAVLAGLGLASGVTGVVADGTGPLLVGLLWTLVLLGATSLAVLNALDRIGDQQMTAEYLASYTGEHVHESRTGVRWVFDMRDGWRREAATPQDA